ncbi:nucleobase-ascorbate transporter 11 [Magnolia sinica]|uniref:nucleobase-ascorbate transporter 11 n=1 Tax=Magnolia sinica TaxID=86752 RepID=UPI002658AA69|nr:nucleobase-ascorbate transporter 11 [Magnolia sinica]
MAGRPVLERASVEAGSSSKAMENTNPGKGQQKPGPWPPKIEPFIPNTNDYNPRELKSWAKRTGFNPNFSGETISSISERDPDEKNAVSGFDFEKGPDRQDESSPKIEIDPVLGRAARTQNTGIEIEPVSGSTNGVERAESDALLGSTRGLRRAETEKRRIRIEPVLESKNVDRVGLGPGLSPKNVGLNGNGNGNGNGHGNVKEVPAVTPTDEPKKDIGKAERQVEIDMFSEPQEPENPVSHRPLGMRCGLKENPGLARLVFYGVQHYLSLAGSLVFIPLIIVPAMGGTDEETASVISTLLLVSGVTTILQSYFGTRLPLVQGSSFVYLAPALVIINSEEFRNLSRNKFRHTMRELQGAIIVGSIFQCILGYTGLMSLLLRLINPVVVAPTVAAVGLAFFSFGFPQAGTCVEISIPQISLVLLFALYLRGVSIFGHRVFKVYAVPLSIVIVWVYAFFLTAGGAYNYKGCSSDIPSSNILLDSCRRHAFTMKHCRTDASNAWRTAAWVRIPYPLQWGIPTFHFRTSIIMIIVSLVASVESVGSYHAAALLVNLSPPTPRIVSRGIGLEGFSSILAGLWGTGTGSTTLIESVRTIDITKMANRRAVVLGAVLLIFFSFVGKVGAILASIPQALAASVLCFTWALVAALGLSTLQYGQTASSRNIIIVGFTLFMSFSVPAYFQQYQPITSIVLPSYYIPYAAASNGPVHSGSKAFDYAINALLSMNMVVAFLVAFVLDNTVPGSRQERGVYIWSAADDTENDPSHLADYSLPKRICKFFPCSKCFGA